MVIEPSRDSQSRSVASSNRSAQSGGEQTTGSSAKVVQWQLPTAMGAIERNMSVESGLWSGRPFAARASSWGSRGSDSQRQSSRRSGPGTPPLDPSLGPPNPRAAQGRLGRLASGHFLFGLPSNNTSPASPARATPWSCVANVAGFMTRLLPRPRISTKPLNDARAQPNHQSHQRRPKKQQQLKMNFHELRNAWEASNEDDYYLMAAEKPRGGEGLARTLEEVFSDDDDEPVDTTPAPRSRPPANARGETPYFSW